MGLALFLATFALQTAAPHATGAPEHQWPGFRGPLGTGVAPHADPPLEWSETKNVRFKIALPGTGHSSPVVWGEHVFLTTAVPHGEALEPAPEHAPGAHDNAPVTHRQELRVLAVRRADGKLAWERTVEIVLPHERAHNTAGFASASPVTDGEHVFAFFGSLGLFALTPEGELAWEIDLGDMQVKHEHGEGSSPALFGGTLVVNWDHEGESFLAAFDKKTGEERWRIARDELTSWSSPIIVPVDGKPQVIVSGTNRTRGYDLETGKVIWQCPGLSRNVVATPVAANGMVFAGSSYEKQAMLAIRLKGAKGELEETENLVWIRRRPTPYVPSPLYLDGALYFLQHYQGRLTRVEAATGAEPTGPFRLEGIGNVYASPVAAAGRLYITDRAGTTEVLSAGREPELLARNRLSDSFSATPALVGRELYLRGEEFLYCIAAE